MDEFILSGTPEQLQQQIPLLYALWRMSQQQENSSGCRFMPQELPPSVVTKAQVFLEFKELDSISKQKKLNNPRYRPVEGFISIRLPYDSSSITFEKVKQTANLIYSKFKGFVWQKGKHKFTYSDKKRGVNNLQILASTQEEGRKVIEQTLDIAGIGFDDKCFFIKSNANPAQRYDETPPLKTFMGKTYRADRQRPTTTLIWQKGHMAIPAKNRTIPICDNKGWIIQELSFLDKYLEEAT